ncbi:aminopeptidase N-like isoform X2 [Bacillus rossius redtenbacheri]|uniref:aminopeptidase N-like isoform X2 n=1 Tax=Bacillus rossius redtenbacheri TaxID=93214 RepID=UPI002FDE1000
MARPNKPTTSLADGRQSQGRNHRAGRAGWFWDRYETSPDMSTYLVAFMVADFLSTEARSGQAHPVTYRVWARPEAINQTSYALRVGPKVLGFYEEYFNLSYPLPKMDMVAIPDFSAGAMENWGLVTYRETSLLYDPEVTSAEQKARVAYVIAHELAHQWFGNLVTMRWWSDLWLNEGFATYVGSLGVNYAHPEWDYLTSEAFENILTTMSLDALKSSHPISVAVGRPDEVQQIFDAISYKKGATLLRSISLFLSEEVFRRGVSNYLQRHQYGNAVQDDLWQSLTAEAHTQGALPSDMTVKTIMDTWTLQTGYPVVSVSRDYQRGTAALTQKRYLLDNSEPQNGTSECWTIPITYSSASQPTFDDTAPQLWMTCDHKVTNISDMPGPGEWVVFNNRVSGLYRVQYDPRNWQLISEALNGAEFTRINVLNRAQLLNDLMNFAWTGDVGYDVALGVSSYLHQERDYVPWRIALGAFSRLDKILRRTPDYHLYRDYLRSLLRPSVARIHDITDVPERYLLLKHHLQLVTWACRLHMGTCREQATQLFREWMVTSHPDSENPIPRDLRSIVYCTAVKYGSEMEWNFVWERYLNANVPSEKNTLLSTLGCTRETWILRRFLQLAHTPDSSIRKQDSRSVFYAITNNIIGYPIAKEFFINNITQIHDYFQPNPGKLSSYITTLAHHMFTQKELDEWRHFLGAHERLLKEAGRAVRQSVESVRVNVLWHRQHYQLFTRALQLRVDS